jgi:hypothetical protein
VNEHAVHTHGKDLHTQLLELRVFLATAEISVAQTKVKSPG